ncbi:4-hydroxythreonine-4-phosphate dehydrogenase PdxA [bacterium]|jgi:4-hydroxythreonine-4-phosphate dehydrogenase|nr:4-hydroxythreonine-4-phosphate dehydrogenase PdxA [bacterium]
MLLAVTPGDPEGIGPEVVWKSFQKNWDFLKRENISPVCFGARAPFDAMGVRIRELKLTDFASQAQAVPSEPTIQIVAAPIKTSKKSLPGFQCGWAIKTAVGEIRKGILGGLVTGPISKERLQQGGFMYPGHTEFLAALCKVRNVTMMLANDQLKITLVTTHLPLSAVSKAITPKAIERAVLHTSASLQDWFRISKPRIAVAALNPHAGENGLLGKEEKKVIGPEITRLQKKHSGRFEISGPHPADTLFAQNQIAELSEKFDAVVCMYHDQGLIPVKLLDFPKTVNVTLGLPIIRTSVDHGVGFDIVGKNKADPSSFGAALLMAADLCKRNSK